MTKIISKRGRENLNHSGRYSAFEVNEIKLCSLDPVYFISRYIKVNHPVLGPVVFPMEKHQIDFINAVHSAQNTIAMMPRQTGMTSKSIALLLWEALFHPQQRIIAQGINCNNTSAMWDLLNFFVDTLPPFLKSLITVKNKVRIEFLNASSISVSTMSANALRGTSFTRLYLDCFAHAPDKLQHEVFQTAAYNRGRILIASTPNGPNNTFAKVWFDANTQANRFTAFKRTIDDLSKPISWKQMIKSQMSVHTWQQDYMCEFVS
ncbi:terminase large subunit domain-containing protein [Acinetobacter sp.]|uniref:terminase large subunit domain-containing protein n=1 Tax=Acinetobacter sp. TaxID=472 RepID=UPI0038901D10